MFQARMWWYGESCPRVPDHLLSRPGRDLSLHREVGPLCACVNTPVSYASATHTHANGFLLATPWVCRTWASHTILTFRKKLVRAWRWESRALGPPVWSRRRRARAVGRFTPLTLQNLNYGALGRPWASGWSKRKIQRNSEIKIGILFFKMLFYKYSPQIRLIYSYMLLYNHLLKNRCCEHIC